MTHLDHPTIQGRPYINPPLAVLLDLHGELLAEHGGASGLRDIGALEASLARPYQLLAYDREHLTIFDLAACLCASLCRNHPFIDGNKRVGFMALGLCLGLNGFELDCSERDAADVILRLAAGELTEDAFRHWVATHSFQL